jgi:hypothetical protein
LTAGDSLGYLAAMGASRRIVIDGVCFRWKYSHGHADVDGEGRCAERFSAWRDGDRRGALRVLFINGKGGSTTTGQGWGGHTGRLLVDGAAYNLNRPAIAAALIRAAMAAGWRPGGERDLERDDGYALLAESGAPSEPRR